MGDEIGVASDLEHAVCAVVIQPRRDEEDLLFLASHAKFSNPLAHCPLAATTLTAPRHKANAWTCVAYPIDKTSNSNAVLHFDIRLAPILQRSLQAYCVCNILLRLIYVQNLFRFGRIIRRKLWMACDL